VLKRVDPKFGEETKNSFTIFAEHDVWHHDKFGTYQETMKITIMVLKLSIRSSYGKLPKDKMRSKEIATSHERQRSFDIMDEVQYDHQRALTTNNPTSKVYRSIDAVKKENIVEPLYLTMLPKASVDMRVDSESKDHEDWNEFHFELQSLDGKYKYKKLPNKMYKY
jgi:hypothetical protein